VIWLNLHQSISSANIAYWQRRYSEINFHTSLTLDRVIRHTVVYYSSTSTYTPNFVQIGKLFMDGQTYIETGIVSRPNNEVYKLVAVLSWTHISLVNCSVWSHHECKLVPHNSSLNSTWNNSLSMAQSHESSKVTLKNIAPWRQFNCEHIIHSLKHSKQNLQSK